MDLEASLEQQDAAWNDRPLLRRVYSEWYRWIDERLSQVPGISVEVGAGIGKLQVVTGDRVVPTDVEATRWARERVDALDLPYDHGSVANIVMVDVFHHLADPARFLDEAARTLALGGRVVMVEPYCSPLSTFVYERFHHERTDVSVDPFTADELSASAPLASNQALPTLVFYERRAETRRRWPVLAIVEEKRFAFLLYPLSGGFTRRPLAPPALYTPLRIVERCLAPLAPLLAFRCLVVLERTAATP